MTKSQITCTFCRKPSRLRRKMVVVGDNSICDNCVTIFNDLIQPQLPGAPITPSIPSEKKLIMAQLNSIKIRNFLDQYIIGQDSAKMAMCVSVVNHYKRMLYAKQKNQSINKSNLLITGPSGSGKSLLVSTVAKFLNVPFISVDATTLTEAGYIGQNVDTIISRLIIEAEGDITSAENGIVFIDEIDKIATGKSRGSTSDAKVNGVQSALLKMVEGCSVPIAMNPEMRRPSMKSMELNTNNILFIVGGAFIGMNDIVASRLKKKSNLGFVAPPTENKDLSSEYQTEDFVEYGMIPEFMGRFSMKAHTTELTEEELGQVLINTKQNILSEYKFYFDVDNIELSFTDDFIATVAHKAKKEKTGVRGLRSICDSIMLPHLYLIPEYQKRSVAKLTFDQTCINQLQIPKIEIYDTQKKLAIKKS